MLEIDEWSGRRVRFVFDIRSRRAGYSGYEYKRASTTTRSYLRCHTRLAYGRQPGWRGGRTSYLPVRFRRTSTPRVGFGTAHLALSASTKMRALSRRAAADVEASRGRYGGPRTPRIEQRSNLRQAFELPSPQARTSLFVRVRPLRHAPPLPRPPSLPARDAVRTYLF